MTTVWVYSTSRLQQAALAGLVDRLGFRAAAEPGGAELAVWDLESERPPYPPAPPLPTLALLEAPEGVLVQLLRQGYRGCLSPRQGREALAQALAALRRGELWAERQVLSRLLGAQDPAQEVTEREQQVLNLLDLALSNKEIAARLGISASTVKVHISSLLAKHGAKRRLELAMRHRRPSRFAALSEPLQSGSKKT